MRALQAEVQPLTRESFIKAMETLEYHDAISSVDVKYSADNHVGASAIFISEIENGSWKTLETLD